MTLTPAQSKLFDFVSLKHGDQKRKYTFLPYVSHLANVAATFDFYDKTPGGIEIALCHDLFEDTDCHVEEIRKVLVSDCKYHFAFSEMIIQGIIDLTDVYTKEDFPQLNREFRKTREAERLSKICSLSQSVKYCDLIDNTSSIVNFDPEFAKTYLPEKYIILNKMTHGNPELLALATKTLARAWEKLGEVSVKAV